MTRCRHRIVRSNNYGEKCQDVFLVALIPVQSLALGDLQIVRKD